MIRSNNLVKLALALTTTAACGRGTVSVSLPEAAGPVQKLAASSWSEVCERAYVNPSSSPGWRDANPDEYAAVVFTIDKLAQYAGMAPFHVHDDGTTPGDRTLCAPLADKLRKAEFHLADVAHDPKFDLRILIKLPAPHLLDLAGAGIPQDRFDQLLPLGDGDTAGEDISWTEDLRTLDLRGNGLETMEPLRIFSSLRRLDLANNQLTEAKFVSVGFNALEHLDLADNPHLETLALDNLTRLGNLDVSRTALTSVSIPIELQTLATLRMESMLYPVTGRVISIGAEATKLVWWSLNGTNASSLDWHGQQLPALRVFEARGAGLTDDTLKDAVAGMPALVSLDLRDNAGIKTPSTLAGLAGLANLSAVALSGTGITSVAALAPAGNLAMIDARGNAIVDAASVPQARVLCSGGTCARPVVSQSFATLPLCRWNGNACADLYGACSSGMPKTQFQKDIYQRADGVHSVTCAGNITLPAPFGAFSQPTYSFRSADGVF